MEQFRSRAAEPTEPTTTPDDFPMKETENVSESDQTAINQDKAVANDLETWEKANGKYGVEYFGIKEIVKEFPVSAQFGVIDGYLRSKSTSPAEYQSLLSSLEKEIGSTDLKTYERIKKLSDYIRIVKKYDEAKKKKEMFMFGH